VGSQGGDRQMSAEAPRRQCGDCSLCCKLLPMQEFKKPAGERCQHQRHGIGCNIYPRRPMACQMWNCRWLAGDDTGLRPDRAHYVVDIMPDYITVVPHDGGPSMNVPVLQVWIDPRYPDAHRDPRLRAFIEEVAMPALIRLNSKDGFVIAPPNVNADRVWYEGGGVSLGREHTAAEKAAAIGPMRIVIEPD
jgi:hypothetical protein